MNKILQKRIEEAAFKYSCSNPSEYENQMYDQTDLEWAYEAGATSALQNQWISVDEALPEYEERVLVAHQHGCQVASLYKDSLRQYWGVAKESPIGADVTHWMNIPSLEGGEK